MGALRVQFQSRRVTTSGIRQRAGDLRQYGDYECPACGAVYPVVNLVLEHFGPRLRFVFRHFR